MGGNNAPGIAEISAFVAVLAVVIYVLGLIELFWPVYGKITHEDTSQALYAISLVPRTVVAGHGAKIFLALPLVIVITFGISYFFASFSSEVVWNYIDQPESGLGIFDDIPDKTLPWIPLVLFVLVLGGLSVLTERLLKK